MRAPIAATLGLVVILLAEIPAARAGESQPVCPATATVAVLAENLSEDRSVELVLDGQLLHPDATCAGPGDAAYSVHVTCAGSGLVRCGRIGGLRPGEWINRAMVDVSDSATEELSQRAVFIGNMAGGGANSLVWIIYPRTFVVEAPTVDALHAALDAATAFTDANPGPALVTFARGAFPGASAPQTIELLKAPACALGSANVCADGLSAGLCLAGSRIVVDALDRDGERGAVVLSVGTCGRRLVHVSGADDVLRGLVFVGSRKPVDPGQSNCQADTITIAGSGARRNRIEQSEVVGPTCGDAISIQDRAGTPDGDGPGDGVVMDSVVRDARDKGIKVAGGAHATIERTCVHDNHNGGIQATLGGHVFARHDVVQHNVPGAAQNGLSATGGAAQERTTLVTDGDIVRFAGGRGLTVTDNAAAAFSNDYVADNQFAGGRVETSTRVSFAATPLAALRGVAFSCNHRTGISGTCQGAAGDTGAPCTAAADCCGAPGGCCVLDPGCAAPLRCGATFSQGIGLAIGAVDGGGTPLVDLGRGDSAGRNAFLLNPVTALGADLVVDVGGLAVSARGNQWESCTTATACNPQRVVADDVRLAPGATVDVGAPRGARGGTPDLLRVVPPRPRQGDLVRVYLDAAVAGASFNAVEGGACADEIAPADPCSADDAPVRRRNQQTQANRLAITTLDGQPLAIFYPDAVTPTMLAFSMPFDCFAPLLLQVTERDANGGRVGRILPLCDAAGCDGQPAGAPCDDGDACTAGDACDGTGACLGAPLACEGPCLACDHRLGCVPRPATASCDDGDACRSEERRVG